MRTALFSKNNIISTAFIKMTEHIKMMLRSTNVVPELKKITRSCPILGLLRVPKVYSYSTVAGISC